MTSGDGDVTPPALGPKGYAGIELTAKERSFYLALANELDARKLSSVIVIPKREGNGFSLEKGQVLRVSCHQGPQVADFNIFNRKNPKECFSASITRVLHGCHVSTHQRLWSHAQYQRPMMTIMADTVGDRVGRAGMLSHDTLFAACDEQHYYRLTGELGMPNCRANLAGAIAPFGLRPEDVHDPLNIFMVTGINEHDRLTYVPPRADQNDYIEFYAEMDLICALSACPGASSGPGPGGLKAEIFDADDSGRAHS